MTLTLRTIGLRRLNTLTKYPSIPTYHALDPKNGSLLEEAIAFAGTALATEKVDGTNTRIVFAPDGSYLLGSREEFLYARGDLIGNPAQGIVEAMRETAERLCAAGAREAVAGDGQAVVVFFGELFGGKVSAASRQYTAQRRISFRLFDIVRIDDVQSRLEMPAEELSAWREAGGQRFEPEETLQAISSRFDLPLTPRIATWDAAALPRTIAEADALLRKAIDRTRCALDEGAGGRPEGLVIRTLDRATIAKLRFEDYERTLRRRK